MWYCNFFHFFSKFFQFLFHLLLSFHISSQCFYLCSHVFCLQGQPWIFSLLKSISLYYLCSLPVPRNSHDNWTFLGCWITILLGRQQGPVGLGIRQICIQILTLLVNSCVIMKRLVSLSLSHLICKAGMMLLHSVRVRIRGNK